MRFVDGAAITRARSESSSLLVARGPVCVLVQVNFSFALRDRAKGEIQICLAGIRC